MTSVLPARVADDADKRPGHDRSPAALAHMRAARLLFDRGLISTADFGSAVADQVNWRSHVGEVLIGKGHVRPLDYYRTLAEVHGLPFVNLLDDPPEGDVLFPEDRENYARLKMVPWRVGEDHCVIAAVEVGTEQIEWAEERFGQKGYSFVITSPFDILWALQACFRDADDLLARDALHQWKPQHSAKRTVTARQIFVMMLCSHAYLAFLLLAPRSCLIATMAAVTVLYTVTFSFKALLTWLGASRKVDMDITDEAVAELTDAELPVCTVIVPIFREARVLPLLFQALRDIDYPASKLEVKLVFEEDDSETIAAAVALKPPGTFEIVRVPASEPRTKPKACNYALLFARGEFVTIYDAEDQPEPDQLKKAVIAFRRGGPKLACIQARLNYFNRTENWLTRMFTLEYSQWFDFLLPGLIKLKMPIPLGGTSNHFRLAALRQVRAWDPFNVTEDADLGIRLAQEGYTIGVINSTTFEEANGVLASWIRQRSRWIKGYMQTWLVHMRHPIDLWRRIGWRGTFCFHFFVGAPALLALMNPIVWTLTILFYLLRNTSYSWLFPEPIGAMATFDLFFANLLLVYFGIVAALKRRYLELLLTGVMQPIYWVLHSIAAYKAFWQLVVKPHYWEKTEHGISSFTEEQLDRLRSSLS